MVKTTGPPTLNVEAMPSPINIQTDSVIDPDLLPLQPHGYEQPGTEPLNLHNNGHTGKMTLASKEM